MIFDKELLGPLLMGSVLLVFGVALFIKGFRRYNLYTLIRDTPTSKIRSMPMGPVEIKGKVEYCDERYILDPLKGEECVFFHFEIEKWKKDKDKNKGGKWKTVDKVTEYVPFYMNDGTGRAKVVPDNKISCEISKSNRNRWQTRYPEENDNLRDFILNNNEINNHYVAGAVKKGDGKLKKFFKKHLKNRPRYRFTQKVIRKEEDIYLYGSAGRLKNADGNKEATTKITSGKRDFFFLSDFKEKNLIKNIRGKLITYFIVAPILIGISGIVFYQLYEKIQ